jgi:hypothetical protein
MSAWRRTTSAATDGITSQNSHVIQAAGGGAFVFGVRYRETFIAEDFGDKRRGLSLSSTISTEPDIAAR